MPCDFLFLDAGVFRSIDVLHGPPKPPRGVRPVRLQGWAGRGGLPPTASNEPRALGYPDVSPFRLLQDDAIAIRIFIGAASRFPVWIEGRYLLEACSHHAGVRGLPLGEDRDGRWCTISPL